jgi:hypothetical protein
MSDETATAEPLPAGESGPAIEGADPLREAAREVADRRRERQQSDTPGTPFAVIRAALLRSHGSMGGESKQAAQNILDDLAKAGFKIVAKGK